MSEGTCGPWEGGLNRFVPQATFGLACALHDEDYTRNPAAISRAEADRRFLQNLYGLADRWWHYPLAVSYYAAVRVFGWYFYRGES
jgi:hypothetical protein